MEDHRGQHCIQAMCRVFDLSVSGYYAWRKNPGSNRSKENIRLVTHIKAVHEESKKTYGSPRIYVELRSRGICCGKNRVARLMRQCGIQAKHKRKYRANGFQS